MDAALPIIAIIAAAAATFYAVSFNELREKSFRDLDESEPETGGGGGFRSSASSRETRARRKAEKEAKK
ncbi:uncharacterized protein A4U43_C03F10660 [Asparagus officinalis]|uniref:Uncharacterized protein n=1 Tax=Asparagus officinalis TaxID=4686 RepID=A0A5P1FD92_ASPOF|nr:uncharacterized protein LOC109832148 [Asparagus officinalis]ONK74839.1 uncharacterized protein A4U43_C03F10660 [Asparagus officinalis]